MSLGWFVVARTVTPTQSWQSQSSYQTIRFSDHVIEISFLPCLLGTVLALSQLPRGGLPVWPAGSHPPPRVTCLMPWGSCFVPRTNPLLWVCLILDSSFWLSKPAALSPLLIMTEMGSKTWPSLFFNLYWVLLVCQTLAKRITWIYNLIYCHP